LPVALAPDVAGAADALAVGAAEAAAVAADVAAGAEVAGLVLAAPDGASAFFSSHAETRTVVPRRAQIPKNARMGALFTTLL